MWISNYPRTIHWKKTFPIDISFHLGLKSIDHACNGLFLDSHFFLCINTCMLMPSATLSWDFIVIGIFERPSVNSNRQQSLRITLIKNDVVVGGEATFIRWSAEDLSGAIMFQLNPERWGEKQLWGEFRKYPWDIMQEAFCQFRLVML